MAEKFEHQEALFTEREVLEGLTADQIVDQILSHGEKVGQLERSMNLASEVLEGAHGVTVEQILEQREREKGNG